MTRDGQRYLCQLAIRGREQWHLSLQRYLCQLTVGSSGTLKCTEVLVSVNCEGYGAVQSSTL